MSLQELSNSTPAIPPVPPRVPNPAAAHQPATSENPAESAAAEATKPETPAKDAPASETASETTEQPTADDTSATESPAVPSADQLKAAIARKTLAITAEQMHVSLIDHFHLNGVKYELLDRHTKSLSLAARVGYQTKLNVNDSFYEQEAARVLFVALRPLFAYLEKGGRIKDLVVKIQRIIAVIGSKGGAGKTPLACYLAAMLQAIAQVACLIIDANHNHGTTGSRLGIQRSTNALLFDALADFDLVKNYSTASMKLGRHQQTGLHALLSNPNKAEETVVLARFIQLFKLLNECFHSIVADTGNGNEHEVNEGSFLMADVIIVSALAYKDESFEAALSTLIGYLQLGHKRKVKDSLKVISATQPDETKEMFLQKFRREAALFIDQERKAEKALGPEFNNPDTLLEALGITLENIHLVPFSNYISKNGVVSLRPEDTGLPTLDAYADILLRAFTMDVPSQEEKQDEIDRRLKARNDPKLPSAQLPPEGASRLEWLIAEVIKESSGNPKLAAMNVLEQSRPQEKEEPVHQ